MRKQEKVRLEKMKQYRRDKNAHNSILKLMMNSMYGVSGKEVFKREAYHGGSIDFFKDGRVEDGVKEFIKDNYLARLTNERSQMILNDVMSLYPEVMKEEI
jgi:hypothetical protein